jgi:hypothetical protein
MIETKCEVAAESLLQLFTTFESMRFTYPTSLEEKNHLSFEQREVKDL